MSIATLIEEDIIEVIQARIETDSEREEAEKYFEGTTINDLIALALD